MEPMKRNSISYKYIGVIIIVLMRLLHEPYRWAQAHLEFKWEQTGHLMRWWLFSGFYFGAEYLLFLGIVAALSARRGQWRLTRDFVLVAADLAGVFFLLALGGIIDVDPILGRALRAISLNYASFVMYGLAVAWFGIFVYRLRMRPTIPGSAL